MSYKTRSNYATGGWCSETKCMNRGKRCGECVMKHLLKIGKRRKAS